METKKPLHPLTIRDVNTETFLNARYVNDLRNKLQAVEIDPRKEQRLAQHECRTCFYLRGERLAMQAFWDWTCNLCGVEGTYSCSAHPKLCTKCATDNSLCRECTGDMDDVQKRRKEL